MKAYFVDTNILIDIKKIFLQEIDPRKSRYHMNYMGLIESISDGKIEILVTPTVYNEIKKGSKKDDFITERFINRFCNVCRFDEKDFELAKKLYFDYISDKEKAVPIFKNINGHVKRNDNDAKILAEVTVLYNKGCYDVVKFITNNIIDFINIDKINKINEKYGLKSIPFNSIKASNVKNEIR